MSGYTNTYNAADPTQAAFLAALQNGENASGNPSLGYGGTDLSTAPTNQYGFPLWGGVATSGGPTHAAGLYQFQPGTFDPIAAQLGLNFQNPADQNAAAWALASHNYAAANGGASLESALQAGDYSGVANTLQSTWASLNPSRLASAFGTGATPSSTGTGGTSAGTASATPSASILSPSTWLPALDADIKNLFVRGGVFLLALVMIAFGLYYLADQATDGAVSDGVKAVAKDAAVAA